MGTFARRIHTAHALTHTMHAARALPTQFANAKTFVANATTPTRHGRRATITTTRATMVPIEELKTTTTKAIRGIGYNEKNAAFVMNRVRNAPKQPGVDAINLPGERGDAIAKANEAKGEIDVETNLWNNLKKAAEAFSG